MATALVSCINGAALLCTWTAVHKPVYYTYVTHTLSPWGQYNCWIFGMISNSEIKNLPGKQIKAKFPFSQLRSTGCLHSKLNRYQKYFSEIQKVSVISFFFFFIKIARSIHYANMATMWQFFFWGKTINWQSIQNQTHK